MSHFQWRSAVADESGGIEMNADSDVLVRALEAIDSLLGRSTEASVHGDNMGLWLLERCVYRDRISTGIWALHLDFASWCADRWQPVPVSRAAFEAALEAAGFYLEYSFCCGVALKDDNRQLGYSWL
jgi:hypothetical protein